MDSNATKTVNSLACEQTMVNKQIKSSTCVNLDKFPSDEIHLSETQDSSQIVLDTSDSSGVPSLPPGLLETIGEDWLNDSAPNVFDGSENNTALADSRDCANQIETQEIINGNASSNVVDKCYVDSDSLYADNSIQENLRMVPRLDILNKKDITLNVFGDHNYSAGPKIDLPSPGADPINVDHLQILRTGHKSKSVEKKIIISKQYFCPYCKTMVTKFARHLEVHHKDIDKVNEMLKLPLKSAKRSAAIAEIRNQGTFLHNTSKKFNTGTLLTSRRSQSGYNRTSKDFKSCDYCKGYYSKQTLRIHLKKCAKNPNKVLLKNKIVTKQKK